MRIKELLMIAAVLGLCMVQSSALADRIYCMNGKPAPEDEWRKDWDICKYEAKKHTDPYSDTFATTADVRSFTKELDLTQSCMRLKGYSVEEDKCS